MTPNSLKRGYKPGSWNKLRRRKHDKIRAYVADLKSKTPCKDCGKIYHPAVMEFDHLGEKKFTISKTCRTWKSLFNEMEKCELVCANCHRLRTVSRAAQIRQSNQHSDQQLFNF
jgi:hypothetical protein